LARIEIVRSDNLTNQEQFYATISAEYDAFIDRLRAKTPDEILVAAYEKVCKEEIVIVFENNFYSEKEYAALLKIENPLDTFYLEWLDTDSADMEEIRVCVEGTVERETGVKFGVENSDTAETTRGEIKVGDWVIAAPGEDYACLVGQVTAIEKLGTQEHDTDNETDDIHVNFVAMDYSQQRREEIENSFGVNNPAAITELALDDVIMAPEMLISITEPDRDKLIELTESYDVAAAYCNAALNSAEEKHADLNLAPAKEKSAFDKALSRGKEKSEAYKAQKSGEPIKTNTKKEALE
jgi:hypothetical protein